MIKNSLYKNKNKHRDEYQSKSFSNFMDDET